MDLLVTIIVITVAFVEILGRNFISGRQVLNDSMYLTPQFEQQRYEDVVLYLTPSQLRALQEDQSSIYSPQVSLSDRPQAEAYPQVSAHQQNGYLHPHQNENVRSLLEYPQPKQTSTNEEPQTNPFVHLVASPSNRPPESVAYNAFQTQKQKRVLKPIQFFPDSDKQPINNEPKAVPESKPQKPAQQIDYDNEITRQKLKEQWLQILKQNVAHYKLIEAISQKQQQSYKNKTNFQYLSQNEDRHNVQKSASEVYNLLRANNEDELKRQRIKVQAEAIANAPPPHVNEEINVKHAPTQFIAHLPGPGSTPDFLPAESFEVNEPQAYETPFDILRTVRIPNVNIQTSQVNRPAPVEVETHIPFPAANNVYGDIQFSPNHVIPLENQTPNQGSWQTHSHVWHH